MRIDKHQAGKHNQRTHGSKTGGRSGHDLYDEDDTGGPLAPVSVTSNPNNLKLGEYLASHPLPLTIAPAKRTRLEKVKDFIRKNKGKLVAVGAGLAGLAVVSAVLSSGRSTSGLNDEEKRNIGELNAVDGETRVTDIKRTVKQRGLSGLAADVVSAGKAEVATASRKVRRLIDGETIREVSKPKEHAPKPETKIDKPSGKNKKGKAADSEGTSSVDLLEYLTPQEKLGAELRMHVDIAQQKKEALDTINRDARHTTPPTKPQIKKSLAQDNELLQEFLREVEGVLSDEKMKKSPQYRDLRDMYVSVSELALNSYVTKTYVLKSALDVDILL